MSEKRRYDVRFLAIMVCAPWPLLDAGVVERWPPQCQLSRLELKRVFRRQQNYDATAKQIYCIVKAWWNQAFVPPQNNLALWDKERLGHETFEPRWTVGRDPNTAAEGSVPMNGAPALRREIRGDSRGRGRSTSGRWAVRSRAQEFFSGLPSAGRPDCHVDWCAPPIGNNGVGSV